MWPNTPGFGCVSERNIQIAKLGANSASVREREMTPPANPFESDANLDALLQSALAGDETSREQIIESCRTYLLAIAQGQLDEPLRAK